MSTGIVVGVRPDQTRHLALYAINQCVVFMRVVSRTTLAAIGDYNDGFSALIRRKCFKLCEIQLSSSLLDNLYLSMHIK